MFRGSALLFACAALAFAGCSGGASSPCSSGTSVPAAGGRDGGTYRLESPQLTLAFPAPIACGRPVEPEDARAQVFDPSNAPIQSALMLHQPTPGGDVDTRGDAPFTWVSFSAQAPGWYHTNVFYEPNLAIAERDVYVVKDRSGAASQDLPFNCANLQRTSLGAWICDARVVRGTEQVQELANSAKTSAFENAVWQYSEGGISRFEDRGSGPLVAQPAAALSTNLLTVEQMIATAEELVLLAPDRLARFKKTDDALSAAGSAALVPAYHPQHLFREGDRLFTAARKDGKDTLACTFVATAPAGMVSSSLPCLTLPGSLVGSADGGFWTYDGDERTLRVFVPEGESLRLRWGASLPIGTNLLSSGVQSLGVARFTALGWLLFPRSGPERIYLERYVIDPGFALTDARGNWIWARSAAGPTITRATQR